jgi:hypothetical protein
MTRSTRLPLTTLLVAALAVPVAAQQATDSTAKTETARAKTDTTNESLAKKISTVPVMEIQHLRPADARGLNVFETPKTDSVPYTGFKLAWGAAFTQQFQGLQHSNTAAVRDDAAGVNQNKLIPIANGFNNAVANLYLNAQVAKGIRVAVTSYASARHHQETWMKEGYVLVDESPIDNELLNLAMLFTTVKIGHFEVNYGDQHFRRTDNGQAMYNPFVGNYILDAFTTEVGGELYLRAGPWMVMGGITGGEIRGQVTAPGKRSPAYLTKVGFDQQFNRDFRFRLTASGYTQDKSASNTLFTGDRAGSRYYDVLENTTSSETANAWSGNIRPGFANEVRSYVVNPFIKYRGAEIFGTIENARGRASSEPANRTVRQYAVDGLYRFWNDKLYLGGRYNTVNGSLVGITNPIKVNRSELGGGWFVTPLLLTKVEYVNQKYLDFPSSDIRNGGQFKGFMVEGVLAF